MENIELLKLFEIVNKWNFPREFPGDDLLVYTFIFIFLGSTMYSMYKLLDRNNLSENLLLMVVPYLLLLVFIVPQSFITIGIFLDTTFIPQSGIMELMGSRLALQCLTITAFMWALSGLHFLLLKVRGARKPLKILIISYISDIPFSVILAVMSALLLFGKTTPMTAKITAYTAYAVLLKLAVTACILLYAALFGRKTRIRLFDGESAMDFLKSYTRSVYSVWAGAMVSIASLLTWLLLSPEENGQTLLETMDFTTICVLIWLIPSVIILMISIFFIIFPEKSPQMKDIAKWGTGDMDAEKMAYELVTEWLCDEAIVRTKEYVITQNFIIKEGLAFRMYDRREAISAEIKPGEFVLYFKNGKKVGIPMNIAEKAYWIRG